MVTLYKRINKDQKKLFRMVRGAVKNALDAHPEIKVDEVTRERFARSTAKRAIGTLMAAWPEMLAPGAERPSRLPDKGAE